MPLVRLASQKCSIYQLRCTHVLDPLQWLIHLNTASRRHAAFRIGTGTSGVRRPQAVAAMAIVTV
jgi:hypothetical protein